MKKQIFKSTSQFDLKPIVLFCFLFLVYSCFAQLSLNSIDLNRISQKKVRNLVKKHQLDGVEFFFDLKSSCYSEQDSFTYSFHSSSQAIKEKIQNVWNIIKRIKPRDEYRGKMVSFGLLYSSKTDRVLYNDDDYQEIEEGEIIFLNLKLLGGIKNMAVALEVTKVDDENKIIQLCYLNNGMTEGTQQIKLSESTDGNTVICQETRYRNMSKFRERWLYPLFHQKAVSELHQNLCLLIENPPNSVKN